MPQISDYTAGAIFIIAASLLVFFAAAAFSYIQRRDAEAKDSNQRRFVAQCRDGNGHKGRIQ